VIAAITGAVTKSDTVQLIGFGSRVCENALIA
jgi:hypothetical protein